MDLVERAHGSSGACLGRALESGRGGTGDDEFVGVGCRVVHALDASVWHAPARKISGYYISAILQTFSSGYFVKGAKVVIDTTMID
jgi:hypothetical protein